MQDMNIDPAAESEEAKDLSKVGDGGKPSPMGAVNHDQPQDVEVPKTREQVEQKPEPKDTLDLDSVNEAHDLSRLDTTTLADDAQASSTSQSQAAQKKPEESLVNDHNSSNIAKQTTSTDTSSKQDITSLDSTPAQLEQDEYRKDSEYGPLQSNNALVAEPEPERKELPPAVDPAPNAEGLNPSNSSPQARDMPPEAHGEGNSAATPPLKLVTEPKVPKTSTSDAQDGLLSTAPPPPAAVATTSVAKDKLPTLSKGFFPPESLPPLDPFHLP